MKILQVTSTFYPALAFGGAVKVILDVSRELVKRGHDVTVYSTNAFDQKRNFQLPKKECMINGIRVRYFKNLLHPDNIFISPDMILTLRKGLRKFDVVHVHFGRQIHDAVTWHCAKNDNVPFVLQAHGSLLRTMAKQRLKRVYDVLFGYRLLRDASKVIALSQTEVQQYRGMGVPEEKIVVIPNGIDLSEYGDLPPKGSFKNKFNIPEDQKIILYLGRIHKTKGIDFLVKAYAYLTKNMKYNDAILVIAGSDDGYLKEVKSLVHSNGLSNRVIFTGFLSEEDKIKAYVDSEICAYLAPHEPFGLVSLEAAACGTPVVVSVGTPMSHFVNEGKFGFLVKYYDIFSFASLLQEILTDEELADELGRNGSKYVFDNFSWSRFIERYEQVYKEVVEERNKRD